MSVSYGGSFPAFPLHTLVRDSDFNYFKYFFATKIRAHTR